MFTDVWCLWCLLMFIIIYYSILQYLFIPLFLSSFIVSVFSMTPRPRSVQIPTPLLVPWTSVAHPCRSPLCRTRPPSWPGSFRCTSVEASRVPSTCTRTGQDGQDSSRMARMALVERLKNVEDLKHSEDTWSVFWVDNMWIITLSHIVSYCHISEITYGHARCSVAF